MSHFEQNFRQSTSAKHSDVFQRLENVIKESLPIVGTMGVNLSSQSIRLHTEVTFVSSEMAFYILIIVHSMI